MKLFYNDDYVAAKYAYDTTRKAKHIRQSLSDDPVDNLEIWDPLHFVERSLEVIAKIHDEPYVDSIKTGIPKTLAESQGFDWDKGIWTSAVAHSAGLIAATTYALQDKERAGSLSSGLHHARRSSGKGNCTVNGLAVAAHQAITMGAPRVLILDFDAHAGGGTWDIISHHLPSVVQLDVTCANFDTYQPDGESRLIYSTPQSYREDINHALHHATLLDPFDIVIYNAGMDPLNSGVSLSDITWREHTVSDFIGDTPAIFALAGGYTWGNKTMDEVVSWHRITIDLWASLETR
ncbi:MAG: hypothetical protein JHD36_09805 [Ilumatobacteraceae bacterium]|nr:hypothetical protein [Ilumatobacteraceae bacterium]